MGFPTAAYIAVGAATLVSFLVICGSIVTIGVLYNDITSLQDEFMDDLKEFKVAF